VGEMRAPDTEGGPFGRRNNRDKLLHLPVGWSNLFRTP
jgi:hypothetical protein